MLSRLLRKNISPARIVGFVLSNFLGLAIILGSLQFYSDVRSLWNSEDGFIQKDYIVINKRVTSRSTLGGAASVFTQSELSELASQPWVRGVAPFSTAAYRIDASLSQGGRGLSTHMFFESIPDSYVDVPASQWHWSEGSDEVPLIISKDYLALYNFGFAGAAGMPQLSEGVMSGIPLSLTMTSEDGSRIIRTHGRIAGYSNRLNTILVPQNFMDWSNRELGSGESVSPSRVIIDVSSPGDVAIGKYMESHDYEVAGDKSASSASFLLRLVVGIVIAVGAVITLLSLFILMLSVSLLMEKNRDKMHSLLMLGYPLSEVGRPYAVTVTVTSCVSLILAVAAMFALRSFYLEPVGELGAERGGVFVSIAAGIVLTIVIIVTNLFAIGKKVKGSWRISR